MITSYPVKNPFGFLGISHEDLKQFKDQLTIIEKYPDPFYRIATDSRKILFLIRDESYPCFDSSDRMYENRYYHYLFYCKDREDLDEKFQYLNGIKFLSTGAQDKPELIPNIFYGDDTRFFEIAE